MLKTTRTHIMHHRRSFRWFVFIALLLIATTAIAQEAITIKVLENNTAFPALDALVEVRDGRGRVMTDLQPDQFTILQDGRPIAPDQIQVVEQTGDNQGPAVAMVLDVSTLLGEDQITAARAAAIAVLQTQLQTSGDTPTVMTLFIPSNDPVQPNQVPDFASFTHDHNSIINYLNEQIKPLPGATRVYAAMRDAVNAVAKKAVERGTSGYVVLFSDGEDQLSATAFDDVLELAKQQQIKILTVAFGPPSTSTSGITRLQQLANETQGSFLDHPTPTQVSESYTRLVQLLPQSTYRISFTSAIPADEETHSWQILVNVNGNETQSQQMLFRALLPSASIRPLSSLMQAYLIWSVPITIIICTVLTMFIALWQRVGREDSRRLRGGLGDARTFKRTNIK